MAFKFSSRFSIVWSTLAIVGGCSQVLGLGDYAVDPSLGAGGAPSDVGEGGQTSTSGKSNMGGKGNAIAGEGPGNGGEPNTPQGGEPNTPQGGEPNAAQAGDAAIGGGGNGTIGGAGGDGGAGGAKAVEVVPCDSTSCCTQLGGTAKGVEMLKDGGFELGTVADGLTPWTETSAQGFPLITDGVTEDATPHKGTYFAFLAGVTNETSDIQSERLKIPADAGWMVLSGYRFFQLDSEKTDTVNQDFMGIGFYDYATTDPLEIPFFWDNSNPGATAGWTRFQAEWDAAPHAGEARYLLLRGSTDDYGTDTALTASNYMIDDLSLMAFSCYK